MFEWIVKISTAAVVLSLTGNILPVGKMRAAALIALGFLFLTLVVFPLKDIISEIGDKKVSIETERDILLSQVENGDYSAYDEVIKVYKDRLKLEINNKLNDKELNLTDINITVDEDINSSSFGTVQNVVATVGILNTENKNKIEQVTVPNIVIDRNGIRIEKSEIAENSENISEKDMEIKKIIKNITGADEKYIIVRWE